LKAASPLVAETPKSVSDTALAKNLAFFAPPAPERIRIHTQRGVSANKTLVFFAPSRESERATKPPFFESYCSLEFEQAAAASQQSAALLVR
jgi:hypothetical protein